MSPITLSVDGYLSAFVARGYWFDSEPGRGVYDKKVFDPHNTVLRDSASIGYTGIVAHRWLTYIARYIKTINSSKTLSRASLLLIILSQLMSPSL